MKKQIYSMPDRTDRTDYAKLAGSEYAAIDYSDIPRIGDPAWTSDIRQNNRSLHVVASERGWTVRVAGTFKSTGRFATKAEAVAAASRLARAHRGALAIHDKDGTLRLFRSFAATR